MEISSTACPVCTLFLREGVTLQAHLDTHPKEQVIEALLKVSNTVSPVQSSTTSPLNNSYAPVQNLTNTNSSYLPQPPPSLYSINPPSQMTTAVTYQHFMTSNGSTVLPQCIQVPIVNSCGNIPLISSPMNLVPNPTLNYSQTAYNPLYNPYIPQPYPFSQPVYPVPTYPVPSYPVVDSNTQTQSPNSSSNQVESSLESSVLVKKCSVATNTDSEKGSSKIESKTTFSRQAALRRKVKILKKKLKESKHSVDNALELPAAKATKPKIAAATSSTNSRMISPPPLTLITGTTNAISSSQNPSPPPLSKAPYFDIRNLGIGEDVTDSGSATITHHVSNSEVVYGNEHQKPLPSMDISECMIRCSNNDMEIPKQQEEEYKMISEKVNNDAVENELPSQSYNHQLELNLKATVVEEAEEEEEEIIVDDKPLDKTSEMIEATEHKIKTANIISNQDLPKEISSENIEKNCNGSNIYIQQENIILNEDSQREKTNVNSYSEYIDVQTVEPVITTTTTTIDENQNDYRFYNEEVNEDIENLSTKQLDSQPVIYTDLQPAKSTRVYQDLGISPYLNLNNYMEVDGIQIFFNNSSTNLPFDSVMKLTDIQDNSRNISPVMKSENHVNGTAIVDSVIQIVSGDKEPKTDLAFRDNYTATTSHVNDIHSERPNMSPLALNIQADESMPARGELSEQESLGAENSSWNLFHGNLIQPKSAEEWRSENTQSISVKCDKKGAKSFKCMTCNEVFSCPKERRVHKNKVHLNKTVKAEKCSPMKKQKSYRCSFCNSVFTSLKDRKMHVFQTHYPDLKNKKSNEVKEENSEQINARGGPVKDETIGQNNFKTEPSMPPPEVDSNNVKYCSRCSLPLVGMKKMREHLRLVHGEVRFKCEACSACYDEEHEYNEHLLLHPLTCDKCGKTFHRRANLNLHLKRHLEVKPYECSLCPKSFITRQKLEEHMNSHSGKKPIKCTLCDKTFSRHSNLIQHRNLHHLNIKRKIKDFVCRCGEVFHSSKKLEWHKEIHEPKPKPCPFCSQKFIHSASVTRHIRRAHLPDYLPGDNREFDNVQCPICEKVYLRSSLVVHMRVHNGEKPFICKICDKRFSTKWNLELHNWTHQSRSNMPFKCTSCKSAFFRESDYVAHVNSHKNYKPFTCNVCGQKFIRKYSCLRHQEEHKKSKQYVCGVSGCAKSFHRGYYLRDHMKVHTGVRPHTCHICGKASSTKSNHNKHVRIHDTREPVNTEN